MPDESHLDLKYFIDETIYNCPFCHRRHVSYTNLGCREFDWSTEKKCRIWRVRCQSCDHLSMHLTFDDLQDERYSSSPRFRDDVDLDTAFFYSVPTSFFVIDTRIPKIIRELITEAEGCIKMNYLTGASACCRKAIYEFTVREKAEGEDYESRIKFLKGKFPAVDPELFDVLCHIKDMTSNKIHEQSWDKWDTKHLKLFLETLKTVLHEIYVVPDERKGRSERVRELLGEIKEKKHK
jgi:hypothetical protein